MVRGKAEVNAQVVASELAVVNARVVASELAVVAALAAASVRAVASVKVAVRELRRSNRSLPIQRRSNSESNSREGKFEGRCLKWIRI